MIETIIEDRSKINFTHVYKRSYSDSYGESYGYSTTAATPYDFKTIIHIRSDEDNDYFVCWKEDMLFAYSFKGHVLTDEYLDKRYKEKESEFLKEVEKIEKANKSKIGLLKQNLDKYRRRK